MMLISLAGPR